MDLSGPPLATCGAVGSSFRHLWSLQVLLQALVELLGPPLATCGAVGSSFRHLFTEGVRPPSLSSSLLVLLLHANRGGADGVCKMIGGGEKLKELKFEKQSAQFGFFREFVWIKINFPIESRMSVK